MLGLFLLLGPCYLFLKMDENDNYQSSVLTYSIFYLIVDIIFALISYSFSKEVNPNITIFSALVWSFVRTGLFYVVMTINKSIQRIVLSSVIFIVLTIILSFIANAIAGNM